jgi:hypothetical protein
MQFGNKRFVFRNDDAGADAGGGADLAAAGPPPPAPDPGPLGNMDVDKVVGDIGLSLFGKEANDEGKPAAGDDTLGGGDQRDTSAAGPAPAPGPAAPAAPAASPAAPAPASGEHAIDLNKPPKTYKPEMAAHWAAVPPPLREEIYRREEAMWKGIEQYKGGAQLAGSMLKALGPLAETARQANIAPDVIVSQLAGVHLHLTNPNIPKAEKLATVQKLLSHYGMELNPGPEPVPGDPDYIDPQVKALHDDVNKLKAERERARQAEVERIYQQNLQELEAFAGDPANIYFDDVADDIATLLRANPKLSLKDAYEKAVYANPVTREKELARLQTEREAKARAENAKRVAEARKAAQGNVPPGRNKGAQTGDTESLDETLTATYRKMFEKS